MLYIRNGASVTANIHINGNVSNTFGAEQMPEEGNYINELAVKDGATVKGNLVNEGNSFGIGMVDESTVTGNIENSGNAFYMQVADGSTVGGSIIHGSVIK